ncbi:MAG: GFA family protein [Chloroflexi bacterium]|nr:GFA family protein [Chloroflexota bacterium]
MSEDDVRVMGGCLCGAVRYEVRGKLRDVVNCHCRMCLRIHGHYGAYTSVEKEKLSYLIDDGLQWYRSVQDDAGGNVYRGFCKHCGSSLFWKLKRRKIISIAAGTLDQVSNLKTAMHIWVSSAADYYEISDDLPKFLEDR